MSPCNKLKTITVNNQPKRKGENLNCIYRLPAKNIDFCLKLKEVSTRCPTRCPFFREGVPGSYKDALEREIDIDCLYSTRRLIPLRNIGGKPVYYCTFYRSPQPLCPMCFYAKYKVEPKKKNKFIESIHIL